MDIKSALSQDRLEPYMNWSKQDWNEAMVLYTLNVNLSEAFYPALHMLEISLRNAVNFKMISRFGESWLTNKSIIRDSFQMDQIEVAICSSRKIQGEGQLANDKIIRKLNFGFWTTFFRRQNNHLWGPNLRTIFNSVIPIQRKNISKKLEDMRRLRNRIAHHETIIQFDLKTLYEECRELIGWISMEGLEWCDSISRFHEVHPGKPIIVGYVKNGEISLSKTKPNQRNKNA